jgi:hypothetical protein
MDTRPFLSAIRNQLNHNKVKAFYSIFGVNEFSIKRMKKEVRLKVNMSERMRIERE